ncbi:hypothetical protein HPP92_003404 [Vanilla planifolia]|uniref:Uncharacterized protein n=1 Tax=Vanilla planifolia TaxID=51239 RepID=A0A835VIV5_VANPL|nr:hypothetical protein HPP92_003404 [Vanilla planifolia]
MFKRFRSGMRQFPKSMAKCSHSLPLHISSLMALSIVLMLSSFTSLVLTASRRPITDAEIRDKKSVCYADIESGLWGLKCKSSITEKENCALRCLSPACYQLIYESDPLEEGEKDHTRSQEYKYCLHKESLGESLERVKGVLEF